MANKIQENFSIVLSSFFLNFESSIKPIIKYLSDIKLNNEVYLTVNFGYKEFDKGDLRRNLIEFLIPYDNIFVSINLNFTGLSKLWNRAISNCSHDWVLVINDNITIKGSLEDFFEKINLIIKKKKYDLILFNDSFSCFLINKNVFEKIGFFDERLIGIGEVDIDFLFKYHKQYHTSIKSFPFNELRLLKINEYDFMDEKEISTILEKNSNPYSGYNSGFLKEKYIKSDKGIFGPFSEKYIIKDEEYNHYPYESFHRKNLTKL